MKMAKVKHTISAAYLERGKTYVVYELDCHLKEVGRKVVSRDDLPEAVAVKCDKYGPYHFREVRIPQ
jgi:hypothetical protein